MKKNLSYLRLHLTGIVLLSLMIIFNACSSDDKKAANSTQTLQKIDITSASSLFIVSSGALKNTKAAGDSNTLFKITSDGYIQEVTYLDENGSEMTLFNYPTGVFNVNTDYVVVIFGYNAINPESGYLVRKSDGAVFDMGDTLPVPASNDYKNGEMIKIDGSGNLYYLYYTPAASSGNSLRKVNIQNPESLTSERVNPDTDSVYDFSVSQVGHVIYNGCLVSDNMVMSNRIIKTNGGLYDISYTRTAHWRGLNGDLFFTAGYDASYFIEHVDINASYVVNVSNYGSALNNIPGSISGNYLINLPDRIIIYSLNYLDTFFEVDNGTQSPQTVSLTGDTLTQVVDVAYSDSYVYIAGKVAGGGIIEKVDPATGAMTPLLTPNDYSVYKLSVDSSELVTFNALRYIDGKKIVATVDASGSGPYTVDIIDETSDIEITTLERIN